MKPIIFSLLIIPILVGMQLAYATNESDYKYGYKDGLWDYHQCRIQLRCDVGTEENTYGDCTTGVLDLSSTPSYHVGNETACNHGYHHGWVKACLNDGGGAMCTAWHDGGPVIAAITAPGHCYHTSNGETCVSGGLIPTSGRDVHESK
jgi:hypothetical protein